MTKNKLAVSRNRSTTHTTNSPNGANGYFHRKKMYHAQICRPSATALPLSEEHKLELPPKESNSPVEERESDPPLEEGHSDLPSAEGHFDISSSRECDSDPLSEGRIFDPLPEEREFELSASESSQSVATSTATIIDESLVSQPATISVANKTMQANFCSVHQTFVTLSPPRDRAASDAAGATTRPEVEEDEAARRRRRRRGTKRKMELMAASLGGYMLRKQARTSGVEK